MQIISTINDEARDLICSYYKYQSQIDNGSGLVPNPQTKEQFVGDVIKNHISNVVLAARTTAALKTAKDAVTQVVKIDLTIDAAIQPK